MNPQLAAYIVQDVLLLVVYFWSYHLWCKYNREAEWILVLIVIDGALLGGVIADTVTFYMRLKHGG